MGTQVVYLAGGPHNGLMMVLPEYWHRLEFPQLSPPCTWWIDDGTPADAVPWFITHVYRRHPEHQACFTYQGTETP